MRLGGPSYLVSHNTQWCNCVFVFYRIAEWTIEVMKAARTSIFEPEVSYFIPAHVTTFPILSVLVACGRCT